MLVSQFMVHQFAQKSVGDLGSTAAGYQGLARTQTDYASADIVREASQMVSVGVPVPVHRLGCHAVASRA